MFVTIVNKDSVFTQDKLCEQFIRYDSNVSWY